MGYSVVRYDELAPHCDDNGLRHTQLKFENHLKISSPVSPPLRNPNAENTKEHHDDTTRHDETTRRREGYVGWYHGSTNKDEMDVVPLADRNPHLGCLHNESHMDSHGGPTVEVEFGDPTRLSFFVAYRDISSGVVGGYRSSPHSPTDDHGRPQPIS